MESREALKAFLNSALTSRWRDRYMGFVTTEKNQGKFLNVLPHRLLDCFDRRVVVTELPNSAWLLPAYSYEPGKEFGAAHASLRSAHSDLGCTVIAVTQDGRFGFYREEDLYDTELLVSTDTAIRRT